MTAEIIELETITTLDIPVERVLKRAERDDLQSVIIIGYDADGAEYFASSISDAPEVLWALERAKLRLLSITQEGNVL